MGFVTEYDFKIRKECSFLFYFHNIIQIMFFICIMSHQQRNIKNIVSFNSLFSSSIIHLFQHFQINLKFPVTLSYPGNHRDSR